MKRIWRKVPPVLMLPALLMLLLILVSCKQVQQDVPPEPPKPGEVGGEAGALAGRATFGGDLYAESSAFIISPSTFELELEQNLLLYAEVDDQGRTPWFVYGSGYITNSAGQWQRFEYDCEQRVGNWCQGDTWKELNINLNEYVVGENYAIAYACTKQGEEWDCHGNKWLLKPFTVVAEEVEPQPQCQSNTDCPPGRFCNAQKQCELPPPEPETPQEVSSTGFTLWATGAESGLLKSTDGGTSWVTVGADTIVWSPAVYFVTSTIGWAIGGKVWKTTNGGISWTIQYTSPQVLYSGHFFNDNIGWAVGTNGYIVKTTNGGTSWNAQTSGTTEWLSSVYFIDANTGWIVGNHGTIFKTTNGGTTWTAQTSGTTSWLQDVYFIDASTGWIAGDNGIMKTTNGGTTWTISSTATGIQSIYFADAMKGWAVGIGKILSTTDGGTSWTTKQTFNTLARTINLKSLYFVDGTTGWAAGSNRTIIKTMDSGQTWNIQHAGGATTSDAKFLYSINGR